MTAFSIDQKEASEQKEEVIAFSQLSSRDVTKILLLMVNTPDNGALQAYIQETEKSRLNLLPITWQNLKLFVGNQNDPGNNFLLKIVRSGASEIEKVGTALRLVSGTTDLERLAKEQRILQIMYRRRDRITRCYDELARLEKGFLAFYDERKEPLQSSVGKKKLMATYANEDGRFVNSFLIEITKRMTLELSFVMMLIGPFFTSFLTAFTIKIAMYVEGCGEAPKLLEEFKEMLILTYKINPQRLLNGNIPPMPEAIEFYGGMLSLLVTFFLGYVCYGYYKQYSTYNQYIRQRLFEVQKLFAMAQEIDDYVRVDPALEALCGHKLAYTRKLLQGKHENAIYNHLSKRFRTLDFSRWSLLFNSTGTLLTSLDKVMQHIHMLDGMLFELSDIGSYVAVLPLLDHKTSHTNRYTYVEYIPDQEGAYIDITFENLWNPFVARGKAVPNTVILDAEKIKAVGIMGPNNCGKSIFTSAIALNMILAQTYGIAAANLARLTPIKSIFVFKEPKDDSGRGKSLYAVDLDVMKAHLAGDKGLTIMDEFLQSTNADEGDAIRVSYLKYLVKHCPKNLSFISTHDDLIIKYLLSIPEGDIVHVQIMRYANRDYTPLYTVAGGETDEQVAIDLLEKELQKYPEIYEEARRLHKQIKKKCKAIVYDL